MKKIIFAVFAIAALSLGFFHFNLFYEEAKKAEIRNLNEQQMIHAKQSARSIEDFAARILQNLDLFSKMEEIIDITPHGKQGIEFLYHSNKEFIRAITRMDEQGVIIHTYPLVSTAGIKISDQKHVQELLKQRKIVASDVFYPVGGGESVALHVPVFRGSEFKGSIAALINFKSLAKRYLEVIRIGETGSAWVLSQGGTILFHQDPEFVGNSIYDIIRGYPELKLIVDDMIKGNSGTAEYIFDRIGNRKVEPTKKYAVYLPIPIADTFWAIAVTSAEQEVLSSVAPFRDKLAILFAVFFIFVVIFSLLIIKTWLMVKEERQRKKAESALLESQSLINAIVNSTSDWIWSVDAERFGLLMFNEGLRNYFKNRRSIVLTLGLRPEDLFPTNDFIQQWRGFYKRALEEGPYSVEYSVYAGSNVLQLTFNLLRRDGITYGLSVFGKDITERKKAEESIKRSLAEKEILLRELYHRTQNNMSVIIALLDFHAEQADDARLTTAFTDAQNRIRAMALVHQKLYAAQDLSYVNLKEYVADLISMLSVSYRISPERITVVSELEDVSVVIDCAIPCGLILDELITNAFKHAFPNGRTGTLRVALLRAPNGPIQIEVSDNGVGVKPGFDFRRSGKMGVQNSLSLVEEQLSGKVSLDLQHGVSWKIEFCDDLYQARV